MKTFPVFLVLALAAAGCTTTGQKVNITEPDIDVAQEVGPQELNYPEGPMELKYDFRITNHWNQPMTVIRVDVQTLNPAGAAYSLRHDFYTVRATIPPGESGDVSFWAKGYGYGRGPRDAEPVTLRAVVYFETPAGTYQKVLMRELQQAP